ncbi:hypothetical protein APHAL10511_006832 [Amanita phalloides]|nr:hypothetical protein APHAL10511_006832 [Amanita phalloides]
MHELLILLLVTHLALAWSTLPTSLVSTARSPPSPTTALVMSSRIHSPSPTLPVSHQSIPTVPSSPPVLPTPFPQPFSAGIPSDNMSVACVNFFTNMTNSLAFRSCRPFSMLFDSSDDFMNSQTNLSLANILVWATCNVTPGKDQCATNLEWFAGQLQMWCPRELQTNTPIATDTLTGLRAYSLMYDAACHVDPATNSYCYVEAVQNSNPSDLYIYQLPLNIMFPNSANPTCSPCSKDIMNLYIAALQNPTLALDLNALVATYNSGARALDTQCGSSFVTVINGAALRSTLSLVRPLSLTLISLLLLL